MRGPAGDRRIRQAAADETQRTKEQTMTWIFKRTEAELWTVGHYTPDGTFEAESDHGDREAAAARVHWLNGGVNDLRLDRYDQQIELLTSGLHATANLIVRAQRRISANDQRVGLLIGSLFEAASALLGTHLRMNALAEQITELQEAPGS
jgi:hypothetical protein